MDELNHAALLHLLLPQGSAISHPMYSCSDFTDDILNDLKIKVPAKHQDNPAAQADLARAEITRLQKDAALYKNLAARLDFASTYIYNNAVLADIYPELGKALKDILHGYKPGRKEIIPPRK